MELFLVGPIGGRTQTNKWILIRRGNEGSLPPAIIVGAGLYDICLIHKISTCDSGAGAGGRCRQCMRAFDGWMEKVAGFFDFFCRRATFFLFLFPFFVIQ